MIILVSDTSVLIDLERGGLLEPAFSCGLTMVVPDLLYARELEADNGPLLRRLGLGVVALVPDEVAFAQQLRKLQPGLSLPDCFALSCARRPGYALVTGDKLLRAEAPITAVRGVWFAVDPRPNGVLGQGWHHPAARGLDAHFESPTQSSASRRGPSAATTLVAYLRIPDLRAD
jgi:predicted nucleic acid-binding protein